MFGADRIAASVGVPCGTRGGIYLSQMAASGLVGGRVRLRRAEAAGRAGQRLGCLLERLSLRWNPVGFAHGQPPASNGWRAKPNANKANKTKARGRGKPMSVRQTKTKQPTQGVTAIALGTYKTVS